MLKRITAAITAAIFVLSAASCSTNGKFDITPNPERENIEESVKTSKAVTAASAKQAAVASEALSAAGAIAASEAKDAVEAKAASSSGKAKTASDNFVCDKVVFDKNAPKDLPAIYIVLANNKKISSIEKEEYTRATIALDGRGFFDDLGPSAANIKGRGNYSWGNPKKPYNIKFDEKTPLCGIGVAKKWALVANYADKTLLRNYITYNLAADVGMKYAPECAMVNLYINGEYVGEYLLVERVEFNKERIDMDTEDGAVLFEIENADRHSKQCDDCIETNRGVHMVIKEPERKDIGDKEFEKLKKQVRVKVQAMEDSLSKGRSEWQKYIDVDSFVLWYIVQEFAKNFDSIFVTSVYAYLDEDGKFVMGPVWDFGEGCYGNQDIATCLSPKGLYIADAPFYQRLFRGNDDFASLVRKKWAELRKSGVIDSVIENIDEAVENTAESTAKNFRKWKSALKDGLRSKYFCDTYEDEIKYVKKWITDRIAYLDKTWGYSS